MRARVAAVVGAPPSNEEAAEEEPEEAAGEGWWAPPAAELDQAQVERLAREWGFEADDLLSGLRSEVESLRAFGVYEEVPAEAAEGADLMKVGVIFKEKDGRVKARVVAKDYAVDKRDGLWTATPSTSGVRTVLAVASMQGREAATADVGTAFLHVPLQRQVFALPPPVLRKPGVIWRLHKALYGLRESPKLFGEFLADVLTKHMDGKRLDAEPQVFVMANGTHLAVHADDLLATGSVQQIQETWQQLKQFVLLKTSDPMKHGVWTKFLGFKYMKVPGGFKASEADGYTDSALELVGMLNCKPLRNMGDKDLKNDLNDDGWDKPLDARTHRLYRGFVGKVNFLARLRTDLVFAAKEMARHLQTPTGKDWARVKKVCRYLQYTKHTEVTFVVGPAKSATLRYYTDSDHAGDKETRKSSTCVVGFLGNCVLAGISKTQSTVATSVGEAELYALATGCGEGLQAQAMLEEMGVFLKLGLYTDSSTAKKVAQRRGPGAMKHL